MTKDVTIQISGMGGQAEEDGAITIASRGSYEYAEGIHYVEYEERMEGLTEALQTKIGIRPGMLVLERVGEITTRMCFEEGQSSRCEYVSPYGTIVLVIYTQEVELREQDGVLEAGIVYDMRSGAELLKDCRIQVTITSMH